MALPVAILLFDNVGDFVVARDFCFQSNLDYMETEVAGHSGLAMFSDQAVVVQFCGNNGLIFGYYPLVNPMGAQPSPDSSGESSPSSGQSSGIASA